MILMCFQMKNYLGGFILAVVLVLGLSSTQAMILFNGDNTVNLTDPGTGAPWESVGKITTVNGTGVVGSAVYLGNGYVLTANHVTVDSTYNFVTFDGTTIYEIDSTQQVAAGVDLKVVKLKTLPTVAAVNLLTTATESSGAGTLVGWGVGRGSEAPGAASVTWGNDSTSFKRWGLNAPADTLTLTYPGYSYEVLRSVAGGNDGAGLLYNPDGLGNDEAALTLYDSGSAMFQQISSTWYLVGVGTAVELSNTSLFGNDSTSGVGKGHANYFARISSYDVPILAAIPEPESTALILGSLGFLGIFWLFRRRPKKI